MRISRMTLGAGLMCLMIGTASADTPAPSVQGPWLGVWKLNVAKSQYQVGKPPEGTERTYAMTATGADTFDIVIDSKSPEGKPTMHMELRGGKFDGKGYKDVGNPVAEFNAFRLIDKRSYDFVETTHDGKQVMKVTVEISADGKTRTSHQEGAGPDGKPIRNTAVWDKQ